MSHPPPPTLAAIGRLFTAVTIALLAAAALILTLAPPARPTLAYPVTPDGSASDWVMAPPPWPNLGHIGRNLAGQGEYVWRDAAGDESAAFASPDPGVDLLEFRLTADRDNLYFTAVLSNVTTASGQNAPQIQIAIDTDQQPGSGGAYLESGNTVSVTANAYWEYLLATPFGSGGSQILVYSGGSFTSPSAAGAAILNPAANTIEAAVPWAALGQSGPPATPLRFTVGLCRAETDNSCRSAGAAPRILDAITNYGDPGLSANTTAETGDNVLDYPFDLFFEPDGDVYPPLRFSELYYDAVGADSDNEWLEIYNAAPISLSLDGVKLGDEETPDGSEGMVQLPDGYTIQPGEALIVAQTTGDILTSGFLWLYGFLPDFEINNSDGSVPDTSPYANWGTNNVALANGGDQALLLDAASTILDVVIYESAAWPGVSSPVTAPTGSSIERAPASQDSNDVATDFIIQPSSGTPGLALLPPTNLVPLRHAITASRNSVVSAQVGGQLDAATVTSRTFVLHGGQSGLITATHSAVNDNLIITPNRPFFQGESVFAIVTNGPRNAAGQQVAAPAQWQFTAGVLAPRCADPSFDSAASANLLNTGESSAAWGDYDNDGDLDILLTGRDSSNTPRALIYQNQAGVFITDTVASANLTGLSGDSAAWGDYDNDGDLDILLTGSDSGGAPRALLYRNQNGVFVFDTAASANLTGVDSGRAVWGDYNNDGSLDILLTGSDSGGAPRTQVYQNQSNIFTLDSAASANLTGLDNSSAAWGDYDNDGDLDILLTGSDNGGAPRALLYENRAGLFITATAASANLTGVNLGDAAWGDYDNDGDLDILLTGSDSGGAPRALLYENQAGLFITDTAASANLTGVSESSAAWGDYDNDGDLDILLAGSDNGGAPRALLYENRGGLFITATAASANLTGVNMGAAAWGDYDNDNDLDILLTGLDSGANPTARLYRNNDCLPDLVVSKTAAPEPAVAGMPLTYTINVTNAGTLTATGVTISDTLPAGVSNVSVTLPPGWQQTGSNPLTFVADTLPVGMTEQFTITVNAPLTSGVITNTAAISSTTADFWPGSNTDAVTTTILPGASYLYLPVALNNYATAPDLAVENIVAAGNSITVTIRNQGAAAIEALAANEFWVDLYVAPNPAPTRVNQIWPNLSSQGAVWGVTVSGLPLPPGGVITLTTGGPYYVANLSQITWPLSPGTPIYVQVDSAHAQTTYGGILENHEITGGTYNNISGPVPVTAAAASAASRRYLPPKPQNWR